MNARLAAPRARSSAGVGTLAVAALVLTGCQRQETVCDSCCDTNVPGPEQAFSAVQSGGRASNTAVEILSSEWTPPEKRAPVPLAHELTRHDGKTVALRDLVGQPVAISFAYTRCTNPNKCRLVTTTMGTLRKQLQEAGLLDKVRLALITYDAQYDTPKIMRDYAARNGLELDEHALFLRPAVDSASRLFRDLNVHAAFNPSGVTMHGIQLLLVDKAGRVARTYRTLIWDNAQVVEDLARLAKE